MRQQFYILLIGILISMLLVSGCMKQSISHPMNKPHEYTDHEVDHHRMHGHGHRMMRHGSTNNQSPFMDSTGENELNIPPLLESDLETERDVYYTIKAQQGKTKIFSSLQTKPLGYNGSFLGPVIKLKEGQNVHLTL